ncbi:MAG: HlyD family efflux transporter periplasmic adaptor subunit [Oscillospiraceae bacterium]|nr:HlyD family efflux transporter periplasmic adaptor subunit [Oscillospiraceae bacterium]
MSARKKSKKKIITIVIILVIIALAVAAMIFSPKPFPYTEETVKNSDISTYYSFSGNIEAKEKQHITADTMMQIKELKVEQGDKVKKDDVLFVTLTGQKVVSKIDGEVATVYAEEGDQLMIGAQIMDLTNYNNLQVTVKVDEFDVSSISVGKKVTATINALEKDVSGKIASLSKEATTVNGVSYFTATIDLNKSADLLVGMSAEIKLLNQSVKNTTTISMKALQFDNENKPFIYYKGADEKVLTKSVEVGINDGLTAQIKDGLKSGDVILVPKSNATFQFGGMRNNNSKD